MALSYNNSVISVSTYDRPAPYMVHTHGKYYMTFTADKKIEIRRSECLHNFGEHATSHVVWEPPFDTGYSDKIRAPELHALKGRWYIYFAAANEKLGNKSHRTYVLGGPDAFQDPAEGHWQFLGPVRGLEHTWSIHATVFKLHDQHYMAYSGWPLNNQNDSELIQNLYIVKMADPLTAETSPVLISTPDRHWEMTKAELGEYGINEGPQFLKSPDEQWQGIIYSASGAWQKGYKMAILHYRGGDPLNALAWYKDDKPLLRHSPHGEGPFGPGHGSFLHLANEVVCVFHGTDHENDGLNNRKAWAQRVYFTSRGPEMGDYVGPFTKNLGEFTRGSRAPEKFELVLKDAAAGP